MRRDDRRLVGPETPLYRTNGILSTKGDWGDVPALIHCSPQGVLNELLSPLVPSLRKVPHDFRSLRR